MLKNLLTIAFLACSASGYAQVLLPKYETPIFDSSNVAEETVEALDASDFTYGMKAPKTSYAYGFYYERPKGVMYRTFNDLGSGMGPMYLCTPAFKEIRITPHVYNEAAPVTWEYRYITKDSTRVVDVTDDVDPETGEFVISPTAPGYYTAA
ncbi:MAG: hypothetical protein Q4F34_05225, partial [Prevotellaceae bacterium]|nr:hypothetical protein [Prevotellaceae bacterium]